MPSPVSLQADVVVLGTGPAGCALALNLAPFHNVLLVDKGVGAGAGRSIGESLPAAAGRLLRDMGLLNTFLQQNHNPRHAITGTWGGHEQWEQDSMRNLDGPGWHLDRTLFDPWLLRIAQERGAALLTHTRLVSSRDQVDGAHWRLNLERAGKPLTVEARFVIDASGRSSYFAKQRGCKRVARDKLVCGWLIGHDSVGGGISHLHSEPEGWWYTAPLPNDRRLLSFYTDSDLDAAASAHSIGGLLARLHYTPKLRNLLDAYGFSADGTFTFCAAHSAALDQASGTGWLAVGDAALSFDPLSAQGLFNALYTGLAGAEAAHSQLAGDEQALSRYESDLHRIQTAYTSHLQAWYDEEQRWRDQFFWQRRHAPTFT